MFEEPDGVDEPPLSETRPYLAVRGDLDDPAGTPDANTLPSLRPYLLTSGRAEPVDQTLEIEAQVLVTDLAALGYLVVERPSFQFSQDSNLIERVIRGLEAIR